jgi:hypothetical protein
LRDRVCKAPQRAELLCPQHFKEPRKTFSFHFLLVCRDDPAPAGKIAS